MKCQEPHDCGLEVPKGHPTEALHQPNIRAIETAIGDIRQYKIVGFQTLKAAQLGVRAINSFDALLEFAQKHHEICEECEGSDKVYNNADPTSGQWVECLYAKAISQAEGR